jgi:hypothetical protein
MSTTNLTILLVVILALILLSHGGVFGRGRWHGRSRWGGWGRRRWWRL